MGECFSGGELSSSSRGDPWAVLRIRSLASRSLQKEKEASARKVGDGKTFC